MHFRHSSNSYILALMFLRVFVVFYLSLFITSLPAQEKFSVVKDFRSAWSRFEDGTYRPLGDRSFTGLNTVYFPLDLRTQSGNFLRLHSARTYYLFVNGRISGEFIGTATLSVDSLLQRQRTAYLRMAIHQDRINARDLETEIVSLKPSARGTGTDIPSRPYWYFRDFVVIAGLIIIIFFLVALRLNPKLGAELFSINRLISSRESDEGHASARLTSGSNMQYYVLCSLLIGFYLLIVLHNLPARFALPIHFEAGSFWMIGLQWLKLSAIIFLAVLLKVFLVFALTRLFGIWGMARYHFFNWIRLLLLVFSAGTIVLFMYFIARGHSEDVFVLFLSVIVMALAAWVVLAFYKLSGRSGHSMFHLFSYLCATEIIPLLITAKVLFQ